MTSKSKRSKQLQKKLLPILRTKYWVLLKYLFEWLILRSGDLVGENTVLERRYVRNINAGINQRKNGEGRGTSVATRRRKEATTRKKAIAAAMDHKTLARG